MPDKRFSKYPPFHGDALRFRAQVPPEKIAELCRMMDLYEGVAFVRTENPKEAIVEFWVSPSFLEDFRLIIEDLSRDVPMNFIQE
ncbi:DUF4911 domain-containing protein [Candidatus Sumerlaeota bacterium]|nr:DUF4911 domain-containing protein [Candidatus Sumerlaeota bacterium]